MERAPFPSDPDEFGADTRVAFSTATQTYILEDEKGEEWEWISDRSKWVPVTDEALIEQQRSAYKVEGVDDESPAVDPRKRKAEAANDSKNGGSNKKQKSEEAKQPRPNTAVYVTSLPDDVTEDEVYDVFVKYGVIAEGIQDSKPRIKLYRDDDGKVKGDALIVYFRPESVQIAINMLDETDFRLGQRVSSGPMRVKAAEASYKYQKEKPVVGEEAKKKGTTAHRDRQNVIKKTQEMNNRLADWDDDDPQAITETSSRWDKVVVLKHMFTLQELAEDPAAIIDIKEDVREEGAKLGDVTNVILYDKEEDGVMTVRFANAISAQACVKLFNGRWFDSRQVEAYIADGSERFKKNSKQDADEQDEKQRLENFSKAIENE